MNITDLVNDLNEVTCDLMDLLDQEREELSATPLENYDDLVSEKSNLVADYNRLIGEIEKHQDALRTLPATEQQKLLDLQVEFNDTKHKNLVAIQRARMSNRKIIDLVTQTPRSDVGSERITTYNRAAQAGTARIAGNARSEATPHSTQLDKTL